MEGCTDFIYQIARIWNPTAHTVIGITFHARRTLTLEEVTKLSIRDIKELFLSKNENSKTFYFIIGLNIVGDSHGKLMKPVLRGDYQCEEASDPRTEDRKSKRMSMKRRSSRRKSKLRKKSKRTERWREEEPSEGRNPMHLRRLALHLYDIYHTLHLNCTCVTHLAYYNFKVILLSIYFLKLVSSALHTQLTA